MANLNRVRMERLRADSLAVHPNAQREVNHTYLKRLMEHFDLDAVGTVHAVRYPIDGKRGTWIVDGQHRVLALVQLGFGEWIVEVMIHEDVKNDARASELFLRLNKRLTVAPYDRYRAEVLSGEETSVGVNDIVRKFGLSVGKQTGDGVLACPVALKKSYKLDDGKALTRALGILNAAYGKKAAAHEGKLIEGVSLVTAANNGNLDEPSLVKKLAKYDGGPSALIGDAKGMLRFYKGSVSRAIAGLVIETYNQGRRTDRLDPI